MKRLPRWLTRHNGLGLIALGAAATTPVVLLARSGSNTSRSAAELVVLLLVALAVAVLLARIGVMLAGIDPDAERIAQHLAVAPDQQRLLTRWLGRTRWARNMAGLAGITWWIFGTSAHGDLLLYGVGGVAVGSMAAQLHHVRRPMGPRTASLARRSVEQYLPAPWRRRMLVVTGLGLVTIAGSMTVNHAGDALGWGIAALAIMTGAHIMQRRVAGRARPALATGLTSADDLARSLAIGRGLAQPATYFGLALIAHGAVHFEDSLGVVATALSAAAWLYALSSWWQNRRLGLDSLLDQPLPAAAA